MFSTASGLIEWLGGKHAFAWLKCVLGEGSTARVRRHVERVRVSPLAQRLAKGAAWSAAGAIASRGLSLFAAILTAQMLGQEVFGELAILQNTVAMFAAFAGLGLGMTATKFIAEHRTKDVHRTGRILGLTTVVSVGSSVAASVLLFLCAPWLASNCLSAPQLGPVLRLGALLLLMTSINGVQMSVLAGFEAFREIARINVLCGVFNFVALLAGMIWLGAQGVVWAWIATSVLNWLLNQTAIRRVGARLGVPAIFRGCWAERRIMRSFSIPVVIGTLLSTVIEWVLLAQLASRTSGLAEVGLFNVARQWSMLILYLPNMLAYTTLPVLSNLLGEGRYDSFKRMLGVNTGLFVASALMTALPVALCAQPILNAYGQGFETGSGALLHMCLYSVLFASHIVIGQAIWAMNNAREAVIFALVRAGMLLAAWTVLRDRGATGLALAYVGTYVVQTIYLIPYVRHKLRVLSVSS